MDLALDSKVMQRRQSLHNGADMTLRALRASVKINTNELTRKGEFDVSTRDSPTSSGVFV